MKHKPKEASSGAVWGRGASCSAGESKSPCVPREQPGEVGSGRWEPEMGRVEEEMSPWCSHVKGKSRREVQQGCGQRLLSPEF